MERYPWENASDLGLARLELQQDLLHDRLTAAQCDRLAEAALAFGEEAAQRCRLQWPSHPPRQLAAALGVRVDLVLTEPPPMLPVRAEYVRSSSDHLIKLYQPVIAETARGIHPYLGEAVTEELIGTTALAHELFHHLEEVELGDLSRTLVPVAVWRLGPWQVTRPLRRLREVGAHAFAQRLVGLPYLPNLWDYLLLVNRGQMKPEALWAAVSPDMSRLEEE